MTAVALIMFNIGILMIVSALQGTSLQDTADAIINGAPLNFTPMPTQANQQTGNHQGSNIAIVGGGAQKKGPSPL